VWRQSPTAIRERESLGEKEPNRERNESQGAEEQIQEEQP